MSMWRGIFKHHHGFKRITAKSSKKSSKEKHLCCPNLILGVSLMPHPLVCPFKKNNRDTRFPRLPTPPNRFHPARWLRSLLPQQNLEGRVGSLVGFNPIQVAKDNQIRSKAVEPSKNRWIIAITYAPWRVVFNLHHKKDAKMFQTATSSNGTSGYARFMSLQ